MIIAPLADQYKLEINIRPIKTAYFVKEDDEQNLVKILQLVCTQWGGIRNLIIPVEQDRVIAPLFEDLLKLNQPNRFVSYLDIEDNETNHLNSKLTNRLESLFPNLTIQLFNGTQYQQFERTAHALGVISDDDLKNQALRNPRLRDSEQYLSLNLALYGQIYPEQESSYQEAIKLDNRDIELGSEQFWKDQTKIDYFASILNLTAYKIRPFAASNPFESNRFDVIVVDTLPSLCLYWNWRATREASQFNQGLGRRTLLLPEKLIDQRSTLDAMFTEVRKELPYVNTESNLHINFLTWQQAMRIRLEQILATFEYLEPFEGNTISVKHTLIRDSSEISVQEVPSDSKLNFAFNQYLSSSSSYHEGLRGQIPLFTKVNPGNNQLLFQPPGDFHNKFSGEIIIDIQSQLWMRFPHKQIVAEMILPGSWFSDYGLSKIERIGSKPPYITRNFNLVDEWDYLHIFFKKHKFDVFINKFGQYSEALVKVVGGLNAVQFLASKSAYALLKTLASKNTKKIADRILKAVETQDLDLFRLLSDQDFAAFDDLKKVSRTYLSLVDDPNVKLSRSELLDLLDVLCRLNVLKRGYYLDCPKCGVPDWYSLHGLTEFIVCKGCSQEFLLPVKGRKVGEIQWDYRLNTLVDRAVDYDTLPAILALYHLTKTSHYSCATLGLELHQDGKAVTDFDFTFVSDQKIYGGECKDGVILEDKDMRNARLASQLRFTKFYFCTLSKFSDESLSKIDELKNEFQTTGILMQVEILDQDVLFDQSPS